MLYFISTWAVIIVTYKILVHIVSKGDTSFSLGEDVRAYKKQLYVYARRWS